MSKLPPIKLINKEDFRDYPWAEKLLWPLNRFMESVYGALNRDVTFGANIRSQLKTVSFETSATIADTFPLKIQPDAEISKTVVPSDIILTKINRTDGTLLADGVTLDWGLGSDGQININFITGLVASTQYIMRTIILYEGGNV